ncbi:MAG: DNA polymerase III subunit chi [Alphaproteobacteria bacterium]|jgi:DNA polymerase-3 subunit chi|nr:DNA polymerase III subunit chi [Alphaproteobacteria bacterium]
MPEVRFYHLIRTGLEQALPELLEKAYGRGLRAVVRAERREELVRLSEALWAHRPESFLPHGVNGQDVREGQPIWLTEGMDEKEGDDVLFLVNVPDNKSIDSYDLICEVFDGTQQTCVARARQRWTLYKEQGFALTYWQQGESGWEKKK